MNIITGKWKYATKVYVLPEYAYFITICPILQKKSLSIPIDHDKSIAHTYCDNDCDLHKFHQELEYHTDLFCSFKDDKQTMKMIFDMVERQALGKQQPQLKLILGLNEEGFAENSQKEWEINTRKVMLNKKE